MTFIEWLPLASACFAGAASPGPSLAVVLANTMAGGRVAGLLTAWAHATGVGLYAAMTVFGLASLIAEFPTVYRVLQVGGALYLLWTARGLLASQGHGNGGEAVGTRRASALRDGFTIAFLNPKLAVFMLALFSQFVAPDASLAVALLLIATAMVIDGVWYSVVTLLLSRRGWLDALRSRARSIDRLFGLLLAAIAIYILTTTWL